MNRSLTGRRAARSRTLAVLLSSSFISIVVSLFLISAVDAAVLRGTVTDPDGRAVPGARVVVTGSRPGAVEVQTNASGRFETVDLASDTYSVRVVIDGFIADPVSVPLSNATAPDLVIALRVSALAESVVVSAAHIDLPLSRTASTVTVMSGAELESRQIRTLGQALSFVPGLTVARNGGFLNVTSLFTRGGESDFTLVLLDGMRLNSFGGGLDLSAVALVDVDRIEIVRGPQSAVFGSDAIGGVVQIVSRQRTQDRVDLMVEGGSFGSVRGRAGASGSRGQSTSGRPSSGQQSMGQNTGTLSWHAAVEHARSDGFTGIAPATGTRVSNDDGTSDHAGFGGGWRAGNGTELQGRAQLSFSKRGFPGPFGSNPIGVYTAIDTISHGDNHRGQVGAEWTQPWGGASSRVRQRTNVTFADFTSTYVSPFGTSDSTSRRRSIRSQTDASLNAAVSVSAGFEAQRERAGSTFVTGKTAEEIPVERWLAGYFAEVRLAPAARWSVAGGVRVEQIRRDALEADPFAFQPRPAFSADSVVSANPKLSAAYLLHGSDGSDTTRIRVSAGTGIRPPDAFEIAFTDNPGLKPERSRSVDAGLQQTFGRGVVAVDATAFYNNYDDLIVAVGTSFRNSSLFRTDNISNARARGLELAFGARPAAGVSVRASYTFLDATIRSVDRAEGQAPSPYRVGEALIRRPRHQGSLAATYVTGRLTTFAAAAVRGQVRDLEPSYGAFGGVFTARGYAVVDLGATVRMARTVEAFVRVENVGGRRYEEAFGFPAPGAAATVGFRFAASR